MKILTALCSGWKPNDNFKPSKLYSMNFSKSAIAILSSAIILYACGSNTDKPAAKDTTDDGDTCRSVIRQSWRTYC